MVSRGTRRGFLPHLSGPRPSPARRPGVWGGERERLCPEGKGAAGQGRPVVRGGEGPTSAGKERRCNVGWEKGLEREKDNGLQGRPRGQQWTQREGISPDQLGGEDRGNTRRWRARGEGRAAGGTLGRECQRPGLPRGQGPGDLAAQPLPRRGAWGRVGILLPTQLCPRRKAGWGWMWGRYCFRACWYSRTGRRLSHGSPGPAQDTDGALPARPREPGHPVRLPASLPGPTSSSRLPAPARKDSPSARPPRLQRGLCSRAWL